MFSKVFDITQEPPAYFCDDCGADDVPVGQPCACRLAAELDEPDAGMYGEYRHRADQARAEIAAMSTHAGGEL